MRQLRDASVDVVLTASPARGHIWERRRCDERVERALSASVRNRATPRDAPPHRGAQIAMDTNG
jgi:hypothetical protein